MRFIYGMSGLLLAGSAALASPAVAQVRATDSDDAAVFEAVVAEVARSAQGEFLVDPRELRMGADLTSVEPSDVGPVSADRERVLRKLAIHTTAFLSDQRCLFAHGLPPAPGHETVTEEQRITRRDCRARAPFTSAILGHAQWDGETVRVAVAKMTTSSYTAREYVLRRCTGTWRIIGTRELIGPIQS